MPAPDTSCLISLVGITAAGSPCFPLPAETDNTALTDSATGFYLDNVAGLRFEVNNNSPARDLYPRLITAREQAALLLRTALQARASFGAAKYGQRGQFGKPGNGTVAPVGTAARVVFTTQLREGAGYRIASVRLETNIATAAVPLLLDGEPVGLLASTNAAPQSVGGILIPLDGAAHTLEAVLPDGVRPLQSQLFCPPCSGGGPWGQSVKASLPTLTAATPSMGFILSVTEECVLGGGDALCHAIDNYPELAMYLGQALMYKSAELFVMDLITEASANRYTMLEPKMLPALRQRYEADAKAAIDWLNSSAGLGSMQHPCYVCAAPAWHPTTNFTR